MSRRKHGATAALAALAISGLLSGCGAGLPQPQQGNAGASGNGSAGIGAAAGHHAPIPGYDGVPSAGADQPDGQSPPPAGPPPIAPSGEPNSAPGQAAPPPAVPPGAAGEYQRALDELNTLPVKGRAPKTGYSRTQFGQRWRDIDRNGCDQRNDILARDLTNVVAPQGCKVVSGTLQDPYTGRTIEFHRGQGTSELVQIDHVVALSDAWQKGAQQLSPEEREQLANDPQNLLAVDGPTNMKKGDGDAATWLPPNKAFRCAYVSKQVQVKTAYRLWITPAEKDAIAGVLGGCAG